MPKDPVRTVLETLQSKVRETPPADRGRPVRISFVPSGLRSHSFAGFTLYEYQRKVWENAYKVIGPDLRFEHLKKSKLDEHLWWFVCAAHLGRTGIVDSFIAAFAEQPETYVHYFPVEHLVVDVMITLPSARLLPPGTVEVPKNALAFEQEVDRFGADTLSAINQFLHFAANEQLTLRKHVRKKLLTHPDRSELVDNLRARDSMRTMEGPRRPS